MFPSSFSSLWPPCLAAGFAPDSGPKLGNCVYGTKCAAKGLPSGSSPAVTGSIDPPAECDFNFIPCPFASGVRSIGLNLSYSLDGSSFTKDYFAQYANVTSAAECREYAESALCNPFGFKKAALASSSASGNFRAQGVAQAPSSAGYGSFFVYMPKSTCPPCEAPSLSSSPTNPPCTSMFASTHTLHAWAQQWFVVAVELPPACV